MQGFSLSSSNFGLEGRERWKMHCSLEIRWGIAGSCDDEDDDDAAAALLDVYKSMEYT